MATALLSLTITWMVTVCILEKSRGSELSNHNPIHPFLLIRTFLLKLLVKDNNMSSLQAFHDFCQEDLHCSCTRERLAQ
jgi:hypothetical protein